MRQFGTQQHIPSPPRQPNDLHGITQKGKTGENYAQIYVSLVNMWENRLQIVCTNPPIKGLLSVNFEYMCWGHTHTRRWITRKHVLVGRSVDAVKTIHYLATEDVQRPCQSDANMFDQIKM